jgi:hypothetical protein
MEWLDLDQALRREVKRHTYPVKRESDEVLVGGAQMQSNLAARLPTRRRNTFENSQTNRYDTELNEITW